jgi:hypothetical protein
MKDILHHPGRARPDGRCQPGARGHLREPAPIVASTLEPQRFYQIVTAEREPCLANVETLPTNRANQGIYGVGDVALAVCLPRPMVAAAIAVHADCSDVPDGRFSTLFSAYTVNRYSWLRGPGHGAS